MKYRIVKRWNKYIPQRRFLRCRWDFSGDPDNSSIEAFDTQKEAEEVIEKDIEEWEEDIVVKVYDK